MAQKNFMGRIALKRDVEATWHGVAQNFVPLDGEMILYKPDSGHNYYRYKIGDGTTTIAKLPFQFDYEKIENEFKPIQGVVISPETSNSYADAFIDTIAQDKDGKITATKKKVGNATITISPGTKLTTGGNFTTNQSTNETITLNHETTTRSNTTNSETVNHGGSFNVIDTISSDTTGHITAVNTKTVTLPQSCLHHITSDKFTTTAGSSTSGSYLATKWAVANVDGITAPYEGMAITFKVPLAGNNGGILLSIDGGTTYYPVVRNVNSLITTHYGVGSTLMLIFNATQTASPYTTSGTTQTITGCWQIADYDSTDKKSSGTSNKVGTKMYIVGGTSQSSSGVTTYTNKNCYIGTDNNLYSNNAKVATESYVSDNYKTIQTAVSDPAAAGNATAFIDSISQDTNGKITVSKKNITAAALGLDRAMSFLGTTTTSLTDGATTNPITISGASTTAAKGDVVIVSGTDQEFIWTGSAWEEFGNASSHSIKGHTHTVSVSGSVSEFLGTVTKNKPTIDVTVGAHPGISVTAPTDEVLGSATTFTAASALNSNVVTSGTTKYLGIGSVALNTDTVTEVTGNTDVTATNTVFGTATSASKITASSVTAAGKTTAGTAISVPQYTFSDVTASKLSTAGSSTDVGATKISSWSAGSSTDVGATKISSWSAGSSTDVGASKVSSWSAGTMSVSGETLTLALPSLSYSGVTASKVTVPSLSYSAVTASKVTVPSLSYSGVTASKVTLPTFTNATASKATAGTAISVPQHTHAADVSASKITANTSITVPVVSSNTSVTASKVTTDNVTVATSVKTQPALSAYTATATGRIKYLESISTSKPGITTEITVGTNDKVNAVTSVSASTSSPTVTAALASDVVTNVAGKTKTVSLSGTAAASTN